MGGPTGGGPINRVHPSQRAAGHNLLHLLVMVAVAMLMADHGLDAAFLERLLDLQALRARHRHRFLECNQLGAALDAELDELQAQVRQGAKAEQVRLQFFRQRRGVGADFWIADFGRRRFEPALVNIADADDFEAGIGIEGSTVVQPALAHADDDNGVSAHNGVTEWWRNGVVEWGTSGMMEGWDGGP